MATVSEFVMLGGFRTKYKVQIEDLGEIKELLK